jgi:cytochrome c oxidase subunit IV
MSIEFLLYLLSALFFALDAFRVSGPISWTPAAFCLLTIALFLL